MDNNYRFIQPISAFEMWAFRKSLKCDLDKEDPKLRWIAHLDLKAKEVANCTNLSHSTENTVLGTCVLESWLSENNIRGKM